MLKLLDLFSGIGGFSLGLERTGGFETVAFCEIDPFCQKVLRKHWPNVRQYTDIKNLTAAQLNADGITVDVISGGFPCQPFSTASHGKRTAKDLWPEMLRIVREIKPRYIIAENVAELPLRRAEREFARLGYRGRARRISASDIGADHIRNRWWLCSHSNDESKFHSAIHEETSGMREVRESVWGWSDYAKSIRVPDGVPSRVDRLKSLGNAVVPQIPELIGRAILSADATLKAKNHDH